MTGNLGRGDNPRYVGDMGVIRASLPTQLPKNDGIVALVGLRAQLLLSIEEDDLFYWFQKKLREGFSFYVYK